MKPLEKSDSTLSVVRHPCPSILIRLLLRISKDFRVVHYIFFSLSSYSVRIFIDQTFALFSLFS